MQPAISIQRLVKRYDSGHVALHGIDLEVRPGEIFALLGPNGAGKSTLINIVCGIVTPTEGRVLAAGRDVVREYRAARTAIGLVPQELATDNYESVWATVKFSRGLYGRAPNPRFLESLLDALSLADKRDARIMTLSGGMKRRVMIAKALAHEPQILFLDEPTAGVDVELRRDMWALVRRLRDQGVTIVLTTHYIEEAEQMADRIGVLDRGSLILVEDKRTLIDQLGERQLRLMLRRPLDAIPAGLSDLGLQLRDRGDELVFTYDATRTIDVSALLRRLTDLSIEITDMQTRQSSLEEIFVKLVSRRS